MTLTLSQLIKQLQELEKENPYRLVYCEAWGKAHIIEEIQIGVDADPNAILLLHKGS